MFQFRRFPTYAYVFSICYTTVPSCGFPHSDIRGSKAVCASPRLFAAYHVLLRLPVPRHSPCALFYLTSSNVFFIRELSGSIFRLIVSLPFFSLRLATECNNCLNLLPFFILSIIQFSRSNRYPALFLPNRFPSIVFSDN